VLKRTLARRRYEHTGSSSRATGSRRFRLDHDNIHFFPGFDPNMNLEYEGRKPKEYWSPDGIVRGGIHGGQPGREGVPMITCVYELLPVPEGCGGTTVCVPCWINTCWIFARLAM
jgi:hypothetical protein